MESSTGQHMPTSPAASQAVFAAHSGCTASSKSGACGSFLNGPEYGRVAAKSRVLDLELPLPKLATAMILGSAASRSTIERSAYLMAFQNVSSPASPDASTGYSMR